jgi:hypothetical protein
MCIDHANMFGASALNVPTLAANTHILGVHVQANIVESIQKTTKLRSRANIVESIQTTTKLHGIANYLV